MAHRQRIRRRISRIASCGALAGLCLGCAHLDPYENMMTTRDAALDAASVYPDLTPRAAAAASMAEPMGPSIVFLGSVPDEIARSEARRRALMQSFRQMSDERTAYNTIVSVLTPAMVYSLVDPGIANADAQHFLVGGVASLAAWNLSLASRTTDPPALYQRAIGRIACLEIESGRYLYTARELPGFEAWNDGIRLSPGSVVARRLPEADANGLASGGGFERSLNAYDDQALQLVKELRDLPDGARLATCAVRPSIDCSRREALLGRSGIDRDEDARAVLAEVEAVEAYARALRGRVLRLYAQVDHDGAMALHASTSAVMEDLRASLQSHQAPLASVLASLDAVNAQVQEAAASAAAAASTIQSALTTLQTTGTAASGSAAKANSGRRTHERTAPKVRSSRDVDLELPDDLRHEFLDPARRAEYGGAKAAVAFRFELEVFRARENDLRHALQDLEDLTGDQDDRASRAGALARRMGCGALKATSTATAIPTSAAETPASTQTPLAPEPTAIR